MFEIPRIQRTLNYDLFKRLDGNRLIKEKHVTEIMELLGENKHSLAYFPILTNENHCLIDGQYRFNAAKNKGHYIYYLVMPGADIKTVIKVNTSRWDWNTENFQYLWEGIGLQDYITLGVFVRKYNIPYGTGIMLLTGSETEGGKRSYGLHKHGNFRVTSLNEGTQIMERIMEMKEFYFRPELRQFIKSVQILYYNKNYDHNRMLIKLKTSDIKLEDCISAKQFLQKLQVIYNFGIREENRVHFLPAE